MKQIENFKTKYVPNSHTETREPPDSFWKQKRSQSFPVGRSNRNSEPLTSYYSTSTSYKPHRNHACNTPPYTKYTSIQTPNGLSLQSCSKSAKDNQYSSSFTATRKPRYDDELGNLTEDNAEDYGEEEATEDDREEVGESPNKDYEEQEADDEIDEETDVCLQTQRTQRGRNGTVLKSQGWRSMDQPDTRRLCCQQHMALMQNHQAGPRYYRTAAEQEIPEPLSGIDFVRMSAKSPTRRQSPEYRQWSPSRNDVERYEEVTPGIQSNRRARTKPDLERMIEAEMNRTRRCNRCGDLSIRKNELGKNGCRLEDRANIPSKGPIGDEPESHGQTFCGRCSSRHGAKEVGIPADVAASVYHQSKARRSRDAKSPTIYAVPEQSMVDKLSYDYSRSPTRCPRKVVEAFTEKPKRSLHTSHGSARIPCRYVE